MDTITMRQRDGLPTQTALPDGTVYCTDAAGLLSAADDNGVDPRHQADMEAAGYTTTSTGRALTDAPAEPAASADEAH